MNKSDRAQLSVICTLIKRATMARDWEGVIHANEKLKALLMPE
jgi:hypothetical protein